MKGVSSFGLLANSTSSASCQMHRAAHAGFYTEEGPGEQDNRVPEFVQLGKVIMEEIQRVGD